MQRDFPDDWRGGLPPLISLGSPVPLASSLSQPSLQNARLPLGTNMNGQAHLGQYNPTHMMHSPHHIPLHPQFNPNYIPDLSNVTISGPLPKWTHVQNMQQSARGPQITPYAYPSPPTNMMYPPMHQGGLIAYPTQPSIVHMQSIPLHQQHHGTRMNNHPRGGGRENGRGGGY